MASRKISVAIKVWIWHHYSMVRDRVSDFLQIKRRMIKSRLLYREERRLLFIACFPKSGSTYLMRLLCEITGFPRAILVQYMGPNEQDFLKTALEQWRFRDGVVQQHMKATHYNLALLKQYGIRPVILVRNIYDVIISLCDHIDNGGPSMPTGYVHRGFFELTQEEKWMFLIRAHLPWYFSFLLSWHEAEGVVSVHWLTYEELFSEQEKVVSQLLQYWDVPVSSERIAKGISSAENQFTRFNQGIAGRGSKLPDAHRQAINEIADACRLPTELRNRIGLNAIYATQRLSVEQNTRKRQHGQICTEYA